MVKLKSIGIPRWPLVLTATVSTVTGMAYAFGDPQRTNVPTLYAVKSVLPIQAWGWVFLLVAAFKLLALSYDRAAPLATALWFGGIVWSFWSVCALFAIFTVPHSSLCAWTLYACVGALNYILGSLVWNIRRR